MTEKPSYLVELHDKWLHHLDGMVASREASQHDGAEAMFTVALTAILANDGHRETARRLHLLATQLLEMGDQMAKAEGGDARTRH
jgi:hypothetical protein